MTPCGLTGSILAGVRDTVVGMVSGFRHLAHSPAASAVLLTQAAHRALFGVLAITTLLLYRNHYAVATPKHRSPGCSRSPQPPQRVPCSPR